MATPSFFYHGHLRRLISAFGQAFSQLRVIRLDQAGTLKQVLGPIPIINRLGDPELRRSIIQAEDAGTLDTKGVAIFPRMGYQLTGLRYAANRAISTTQRMLYPTDNPSTIKVVGSPVPWDFGIELIGVGKTSNDVYQLVEQILPKFNPTFTLVIGDDPISNEHCDIKIRLEGVNVTDNGQNPSSDVSREVFFTMQMTAEYHLYGPGGTDLEDQVAQAMGGTYGPAIKPAINQYVVDVFTDPAAFYDSDQADLQWVVIEVDGQRQPLAIEPPGTY